VSGYQRAEAVVVVQVVKGVWEVGRDEVEAVMGREAELQGIVTRAGGRSSVNSISVSKVWQCC
jgi:hypothetical protein